MLNDCKYRPKGDHYNGEMGVFIQERNADMRNLLGEKVRTLQR